MPPQVGDTARIKLVTKSIASELPDVDAQDSLRDCAKLVYDRMFNSIDRATALAETRDGQPGRIWRGRIRSDVFYALWPRLGDTMLVSNEQRNSIINKMLDHLYDSRVVMGVKSGDRYNAAAWWVNDHWSSLVVSNVRDAEPVAGFPCRGGCDQVMETVAARMGHEYHIHRVAVSPHGTTYSYDDPGYTPEYIMETVLEIVNTSTVGLSYNSVSRLANSKDPRIGPTATTAALEALMKSSAIMRKMGGSYMVYLPVPPQEETPAEEFSFVGAVEGLVAAIHEERDLEADAEVMAQNGVPEGERTIDELVHTIQTSMDRGVRKLNGAAQSLSFLIARIEELKARAEKAERELAAIKMKTIGGASAVEVKQLREELEKVTAERDEFKAKLDEWSNALSVLGIKK